MNDRIEQCKADIARLREELARLEAPPEPRLGDIVVCDSDGQTRVVLEDESGELCAHHLTKGRIVCTSDTRVLYKSGYYTVVSNVFDLCGEE